MVVFSSLPWRLVLPVLWSESIKSSVKTNVFMLSGIVFHHLYSKLKTGSVPTGHSSQAVSNTGLNSDLEGYSVQPCSVWSTERRKHHPDWLPVPLEYRPLGQGSQVEEVEVKKPGLHGGQLCFSPEAGSVTDPSKVSLQILGSFHLYMSCV